MLKKVFILGLLIVAMLAGCKEKVSTSCAVLVKPQENTGILVYCDENYDVLYRKEIGYPADVFFNETGTYFCLDETGGEYRVVLKDSNKITAGLEKVEGELLYVGSGGIYLSALENTVYFYDGKQKINYDVETVSFISLNDKLYIYGSDGFIYIISGKDGSLVNKYEVFTSDESEINMTTMDGNVYMFGKDGLKQLNEDGCGMTYIYPVVLDEIYGGKGNYISGLQGDEYVTYEMKIVNHRLEFSFVADSSYYEDYDFERYFSSLYKQGFEILYFYEY